MPSQWPPDIYNYEFHEIQIPNLARMDLEGGFWFWRQYCNKSRDQEGKSAEENVLAGLLVGAIVLGGTFLIYVNSFGRCSSGGGDGGGMKGMPLPRRV